MAHRLFYVAERDLAVESGRFRFLYVCACVKNLYIIKRLYIGTKFSIYFLR